MAHRGRITHARLMCGAAMLALLSNGGVAAAQESAKFNIAPQPLASALNEFAVQSPWPILYTSQMTGGKTTAGVNGETDPELALNTLLQGTGLGYRREGNTFLIVSASDPQSGSAAGDGADQGTVQALIVTAQKREENIQDVPIAMSAFTQEDLTRSQVATGADLMTQVPNMTFTKTNFTSYSIQIRGIGTQAISATVDPAVAVAFNNTPFLRAHFFEQEFYDMERVEVLRGPQGTLYGRNATAGVVNLISAKPKFHFEAKASADISNYSSHRLEGMLNLPLVEDKVALRLAGAWTKRDGFVTNQLSGKPIDGRDLWSTRISLRIDPTETLRSNFIWEHFEEDDDRLRSGKQTCKKASTPATVGGFPTNVGSGATPLSNPVHYLSQGCDPVSVYSPEAYQTPDGLTLPFYFPLGFLGAPVLDDSFDVYASRTQSRDLRTIESQLDASYRASSDIVELNVDYDLSEHLTLSSQTGYNRDFIFSTQDYNRFNTSAGAFFYTEPQPFGLNWNSRLTPGGTPVFSPAAGALAGQPCNPAVDSLCVTPGRFCDPQIGCSDRLLLKDLAMGRSRQFSQEFRIASDFDGRFNFSVGANYLRYKTLEDYYVFINSITLTMAYFRRNADGGVDPWDPLSTDNSGCMRHGFDTVSSEIPADPQGSTCGYIDNNPIESLDGQGHNYFRSQNPYRLQSYAAFGEAYYDITPNLKLTAGLRWTVDKKLFESIPSQVLVPTYGYPTIAEIKQEWREPTGRLVLNWQPDLSFTDQTMVYASYTHGYKAGGANPPGAVLLVNRGGDIPFPTHPAKFDAEFLNAYEIGTKNTLLDGRLTANLTGFYYDYTGYQISQIVDRSAINLNFDAKIWGVELETDWRPLENLRFGLKVGYEDTRVADGQKAVDLMDRANGGRPDENGVSWMVVKPFPTQASNCILPVYVVATALEMNPAAISEACTNAYLANEDPVTRLPYQLDPAVDYFGRPIPSTYHGFNPETAPNRGAGIDQDLSGNALPNAPHWTGTLTADYTVPLPAEWLMTLHTDLYYQSEAWTRIFNMEGFDKLKAYTNANVAAIFSNEDAGWTVMAYVKNIFDKDNITGAFLNSDDTGLTNNVFLNEPRLYGLRVTKNWSGSPWWGPAGPARSFPLRIELEGYHQGTGADHDTFLPGVNVPDPYIGQFPEGIEYPTGAQNDLAAANGGGVRLTWRPEGSAWNVAGGIRYGRAGGGTYRHKTKDFGHEVCLIPGIGCRYVSSVGGDASPAAALGKYGWHTYIDSTTSNEEAHTFADFSVGREFGLGTVAARPVKSSLSLGVQYARFKSSSDATLRGSPDLYYPDNVVEFTPYFHFNYAHQTRLNDRIQSHREFTGFGPELSWDASLPLMGDQAAAGAVDLDVGLAGTVLFGKQKTSTAGRLQGSYGHGLGGPFSENYGPDPLYDLLLNNPQRTTSITVPGVRANLGLSYSLGGMKLSGGYRWERYYNVIDGGLEKHKDYDRTFDGPYFKIAVGFGG